MPFLKWSKDKSNSSTRLSGLQECRFCYPGYFSLLFLTPGLIFAKTNKHGTDEKIQRTVLVNFLCINGSPVVCDLFSLGVVDADPSVPDYRVR
jgi:hypothetical protein